MAVASTVLLGIAWTEAAVATIMLQSTIQVYHAHQPHHQLPLHYQHPPQSQQQRHRLHSHAAAPRRPQLLHRADQAPPLLPLLP